MNTHDVVNDKRDPVVKLRALIQNEITQGSTLRPVEIYSRNLEQFA